ncbi:hypothetical protein SDC9_41232 [bioreactor metagenome]|uniref:Phage portal protein n=1 Tax=bioreactor metagenome TaxID=1076179 RepID=A0A644VUI6_9ZZZZ
MAETKNTPVTDDPDRHQKALDFAWRFAQLQKQALVNLQSTSSSSVTYTRYTKEDLLRYMQTPKSNEKNIRNASIYMYDASAQYRRLILYYAQMAIWAYTISPIGFDILKSNADTMRKSYMKAIQQTETMNICHEMQKALIVVFREGILYGVQRSGNNSFFIQRINPDICKLSSIVDGTWLYAVDFSQIKEDDLGLYPDEFTAMWNAYKNGSASKWQEIPEDISFCLKADETTSAYSIPPWASTLPILYDIELFKSLQETASEISNYKLIGLEIPVDKDGNPQLDWELAFQYYQQLAGQLPPYVGAVMSPMKMSSMNFEKSSGTQDVDTVSRAEEQFWRQGGTSPLLFGSSDNDTAGALKLSVSADEEIVFGLMAQAERLFNRILKQMSGTQKFKINILPATTFNRDDLMGKYKEAATLGIPVKSAYAALLGLSPGDVMGMNYIELDILGMGELTPLNSSYTQSDPGRHQSDAGDLSGSGEQTRDDDTNSNR